MPSPKKLRTHVYRILIVGSVLAAFLSPPFQWFWEAVREFLWPRRPPKVTVVDPDTSVPAPPPLVEPPPPSRINPWNDAISADQLPEALGLGWEDTRIRSLLTPLGSPTEAHDHGKLWHYCFREHGLELVFDTKGQLYAVLFLTDLRDGYKTFQGVLFGGITTNLDRNEVRELNGWRQPEIHGDTDCYPKSGSEFCLVYQRKNGKERILNAILKISEAHPRFQHDWPFKCSRGKLWPQPPLLPTMRGGRSLPSLLTAD